MSEVSECWDNGASRQGAYTQWRNRSPPEKKSKLCSVSGSGIGSLTAEAR